MVKIEPLTFQKLLLDWFDQHGRKNLPWQQEKTPYRVWISEIMLQQTQVATVIPYYLRFIKRFSDVFSLARAELDEILHVWAGLGYYSRARHMHQTANIIADSYHGQFPSSLDQLIKLPGIGKSTAGAILSLAFNQPATILDGNVKRVLTRLHGIKEPINEIKIENKLWELAHKYSSSQHPADYTQAMMDLGATYCLRTHAKCNFCPFQRYCLAYKQSIVDQLPQKKVKQKIPIRQVTFLVLKKNNQVLLHKRAASGVWKGLWSFPEIPGHAKKNSVHAFCQKKLGHTIISYQPLNAFRHSFTHYHLDIFPIKIGIKSCATPHHLKDNNQMWYKLNEPQIIGLPKPIQTILRGLISCA